MELIANLPPCLIGIPPVRISLMMSSSVMACRTAVCLSPYYESAIPETNWLAIGQAALNQVFDDHGGVIRYFSSNGIRKMERDIGNAPLKRLSEFLRCYLVESSNDGAIITVGKRHPKKHIRRH